MKYLPRCAEGTTVDHVLFLLALIRFESFKICQLIATVLCGVLSGLMGIRSKTAAVASITLYYLFRTFTYGSLAVFAAECFPVSIKIPHLTFNHFFFE